MKWKGEKAKSPLRAPGAGEQENPRRKLTFFLETPRAASTRRCPLSSVVSIALEVGGERKGRLKPSTIMQTFKMMNGKAAATQRRINVANGIKGVQ